MSAIGPIATRFKLGLDVSFQSKKRKWLMRNRERMLARVKLRKRHRVARGRA